ncbi:MAG: replication protein [Cocleimonas sp.]|nr:replication protein [Cocleimonas sp.]
MSIYRNLVENALAANLTKNEHKVFLGLILETIGYGKDHAHLTDKRLVQITGIRIDRFHIAMAGVIEKKVFDRVESNHYDYRYTIPNQFLTEKADTPSVIKISTEFRN